MESTFTQQIDKIMTPSVTSPNLEDSLLQEWRHELSIKTWGEDLLWMSTICNVTHDYKTVGLSAVMVSLGRCLRPSRPCWSWQCFWHLSCQVKDYHLKLTWHLTSHTRHLLMSMKTSNQSSLWMNWWRITSLSLKSTLWTTMNKSWIWWILVKIPMTQDFTED